MAKPNITGNAVLFSMAIALGVVSWDARTRELCWRGMRHSLSLVKGVPQISESDIFDELDRAVDEKLRGR